MLNCVPQIGQYVCSESGCHLGNTTSERAHGVVADTAGGGRVIGLTGSDPVTDGLLVGDPDAPVSLDTKLGSGDEGPPLAA